MNNEFNSTDVAMAAMNHPKGYEILALVHELVQKNTLMSFAADASPSLKTIEVTNTSGYTSTQKVFDSAQLPRSLELQHQGVNLESSELLAVVAQYPQRLKTAIHAWLKWAYCTEVEYPTRSLIKAIEDNWHL
ncbi:hypothetical protein [Roseofilum capinflatum]|uniref:Uncharacterized protein n=1 Tax=Roseofilum capinflatum BLCC-M114 TaxID=3022440 RepID=A0ABT7B5E7_9CYAN|nr:hypothetical protein [Roseofilum capinflatum]MDJ1174384.1 hypothetical protein [Roseofilum capinflatum BLCC-M114]